MPAPLPLVMPTDEVVLAATAAPRPVSWTYFDTRALEALEEQVAEPARNWPTFEVRVGGALLTNFHTDLSLSIEGTDIGEDVDFEDELGFQGTANIFRADASYHFGRRHQINLSYFDIRRNSGRRLDTEIDWGDETYPIGADINSFFDTKVLKVTYQWNFLAEDTWSLGAAIGVHWIGLSTGISAEVNVGGSAGQVDQSADFNQGVPFPVLGLHADWRVTDWLKLYGGADFLWVQFGQAGSLTGIEGYLIDAIVGAEAMVLGPVGLGVGYNYFELSADFEKDRLTLGGDYRYQGLLLFGTLAF